MVAQGVILSHLVLGQDRKLGLKVLNSVVNGISRRSGDVYPLGFPVNDAPKDRRKDQDVL